MRRRSPPPATLATLTSALTFAPRAASAGAAVSRRLDFCFVVALLFARSNSFVAPSTCKFNHSKYLMPLAWLTQLCLKATTLVEHRGVAAARSAAVSPRLGVSCVVAP